MASLEDIAKTFSLKELPESEVELAGEIPFEDIAPLREKALQHFGQELELPGFRRGHVPLDMVQKKVGDIALLEEAVELFMPDFYPALIASRELDAVGRPNISITKLAPGNPVGITIRTTVYPNIALPKGWQALGKSIELETVPDILDAEVDEALESIRRAHAKANDTPAEGGTSSGVVHLANEGVPPEASGEQLPALDDAFAQSLGQFTDLADLKAKLKENMKNEKEQHAKERRRGKIIEVLLEKASVAIPNIFIESELDKIMGQMAEDVKRFGMSVEEYLKKLNKSEADIRNEFREQARKRAKLQLLLNKIAEEEKIEADKEAVDTEMKHALEHFPDARPDLLKIHIETVLRNEKVLQLLEKSE